MTELSYQQTIAALFVSLFLTFTCGYVIGNRDRSTPTQLPSNFDTVAMTAENVLLRDEVKTCRSREGTAH